MAPRQAKMSKANPKRRGRKKRSRINQLGLVAFIAFVFFTPEARQFVLAKWAEVEDYLMEAIAPFQVCIVPMKMHKSVRVKEAAEALYAELKAKGVEVILDDRNERPGSMFADMELIGIPHRIVIGERGVDNNSFEYLNRRQGEKKELSKEALFAELGI